MKNLLRSLLFVTCLIAVGFTLLAKKKRVVFLGDSITQAAVQPGGYINLLREAMTAAGQGEAYEFIGAGISGNKVPDLQNRLDKDVLARKPDVVFVYIGVNDVWHFTHPSTNGKGTPKDVYEAGMNDLISRLRKAGARVILCTPAAIGEKHQGDNPQDAMLDEYADLSRKIAKANQLPLCDLRKAFMDFSKIKNSQNDEKGLLTTDGVHLNAAGNAFVALQMMPFLVD
ncbi:MAG: SGNH/GDSL hydrolase family protein [Ferruginibacter sp.]|nr:SGNH/GDSL hydrolase family protein [Cytophagales bacterium]